MLVHNNNKKKDNCAMGKNNISQSKSQAKRLKIKSLGQQLIHAVTEGSGLSNWEAKILVKTVEEVYFSDPELLEQQDGQLKYICISASEGAGKELKECEMKPVILTLYDDEDTKSLPHADKQASVLVRERRIMRLTSEAKEQGGLLSQEDLAKILMCDVRTIRRNIKDLSDSGIIVPTRGQQKDIGPGVTHRGIAIRLWLEGVEPAEICNKIKHSIGAVENYLEKFKRVAFLRMKNFTDEQIALTVGISISATKTFVEIYKEFGGKAFTAQRIAEIELVGQEFYSAQDEKKDSILQKDTSGIGRLQ